MSSSPQMLSSSIALSLKFQTSISSHLLGLMLLKARFSNSHRKSQTSLSFKWGMKVKAALRTLAACLCASVALLG
jgi:hypothetical protein